MEKITAYLIKPTVFDSTVKAWNEDIYLPTYEIGAEEKNPVFLEKRVYQGSSGSVYPYPVVEKISDEKKDKLYHALFIENRYLKLMILPQLGGRVQMAFDKIKNRHFVYYNQVIKPALVGLTGPWISGGIEFNWPQHHRPGTFLPTDFSVENNSDGSKTIWCSEVERMSRTKGMHSFTLYPDRAYLEIKVQVFNRTPFPQTFLWWANPAVVVHNDYHSVFPPDVHAVYDHGKRDVSSFPIARGTYYKVDYSAGVDISKYKNIPVPTSYMAVKSKYDFVGGYEQNVRGGLLHVANHHVSPGKKQWTWGYGDFGQAWDRNLTDEDGPYIELMTGVFTDNQPDFSWLQPFEEKSWKQYFMPYSELGYVKNATKDAMVNLEFEGKKATIMLYTTRVFQNAKVLLSHQSGKILFQKQIDISPDQPQIIRIDKEAYPSHELQLALFDAKEQLLVSYQPEKELEKPIPEPEKAALAPEKIESLEQLFLTGLHLEQYRHATYNPMDYYLEGLKREPGDSRCNNAVGLLWMRKGQFQIAESYFKKAIETLTQRNPNPYDGEPYYNLGWSFFMQQKWDKAYEPFYKATWNAPWQDSAFFALAQIDCLSERWENALEHIHLSLIRNTQNHKARQLKASILRKLNREHEAIAWISDSLKTDGFNMGCWFESYLITQKPNDLVQFKSLMRDSVHSYLEYSFDFANAGFYTEAFQILSIYSDLVHRVYPMVYYAMGYYSSQMKALPQAHNFYLLAENAQPDYCFPNRLEEVVILQQAISSLVKAPKALYYLGNFWYSARQYSNAVNCWEQSIQLDTKFPTVHRNLALAYYNKMDRKVEARTLMIKAFELDNTDARILMELDQLDKKMGRNPEERLDFLERNKTLVESRDDLTLEQATLLCQLGKFQEAKWLIDTRKFHPWEGGEGKVTGLYSLIRVALAKKAIIDHRLNEALGLLSETEHYPHHLGEGKLVNAAENDIHFYKGLIHFLQNNVEKAHQEWQKATMGDKEPVQAFFYNDSQPDKIFYQGLAHRKLGNEPEATACFKRLIQHGEQHLSDQVPIDYFAVSLPDLAIWDENLNKRNKIHCHFVMGLGHLGLHNPEKASEYFKQVLEPDINHMGALIHWELLSNKKYYKNFI
jgi:tetratricopeptide (TPR) repeat protein